jgi:hypothetical protein
MDETVINELLEMVIHIQFTWKLIQFRRVHCERVSHLAIVREFSVQLWSVKQRTTEAEEVTVL